MPRISATIEENQIERIDKIAHNRSKFIRDAIDEKIKRTRDEQKTLAELENQVSKLEESTVGEERVQDIENQLTRVLDRIETLETELMNAQATQEELQDRVETMNESRSLF